MSSNFDNEFNEEKNNAPKKLDWIVLAGFIVFMVAMIGAVFGQNFRWLGAAFLIMPIVIGIGLFNNIYVSYQVYTNTSLLVIQLLT